MNEGALSGQDERSANSGWIWDKYELREYEVDPHDLSAETVATKIDRILDLSSSR
jgi:hypothetical protein